MVASTSSVYYDPFDVEIDADPYPTFARLRDVQNFELALIDVALDASTHKLALSHWARSSR